MSTSKWLADRWYDRKNTSHYTLHNRYKKPAAWFKRAISYPDKTFEIEHNLEMIITAAVVFPRQAAWRASMNIPWSMAIFPPREPWVIIIGSMHNREEWIQQAQEHGAQAWQVTGRGHVFRYFPRNHEALPAQGRQVPVGPRRGRARHCAPGRVNQEEVISDLKSRQFTDGAIAARHQVSRQAIYRIKKKLGLVRQSKKLAQLA